MAAVLIAGLAGVGKSSLVRELIKRNLNAHDADLVLNTHDPDRAPRLGNWVDAQGRISREYRSSAEWRAAHIFLWDEPTLRRLVSVPEGDGILYLAGTASNGYDLASLFDGVIALRATRETLISRRSMDSWSTPYPFKSDRSSLGDVNAEILLFENKAQQHGAEFVDAEPNVTQVADAVVRTAENIVKRGPRRPPKSRHC